MQVGAVLDMTTRQVKNVVTPTNSPDAVNLSYARSNFAKVSASDNRLIPKRYGAYTTEFDAFGVIDISSSWLPSATGLYGTGSFQNLVPITANTQSLGAHGRQWNMVHAKRHYGEQLISTSDTFKMGSMDPVLGSINTWWEATSAGIYPIGSRDLGANLSRVNTVYTSNVKNCGLINFATGAYIGALDVTQMNVMDTMNLNGKRIT